jgi:AcrR family transcriptional regulator
MAKKLNNALPEKVLLLMQHRRDKILASATDLLSSPDNAAFSLRKLAAAADVTVPTIYNLVGGKTEILLALQTRLVEDTEKGLQLLGDEHILDIVDLIISGSIDSIATNEAYYRGAMLAMNELRQVEGGSPEYVACNAAHSSVPASIPSHALPVLPIEQDV